MDLGDLPHRIFADGEEPIGDRVNSYFKLNTIKIVLKALQPEELDTIKPAFGKLLEVYNRPAYSGKLCHFMLSRQLVVNKPHEIWIVFSGKPIRMSLREFALVTGLNCKPLPPTDTVTVKSKPGVAPYWFTLFGGEENVTGEMLTSMLKKPKNLSPEVRVKYACLLLVDGLLCRRSLNMKIPKEHVEMIRELDFFLAYPWGRYAFDMTIQCIKTRTFNQLAQSTVAVQGFIHAMQLVLLEAVPASLTAVGDSTDSESGEEDSRPVSALKLDKLWELDGNTEASVTSIIKEHDESDDVHDYSWPDEADDPCVDRMVHLIGEGFNFNRDMFVGGQSGNQGPPVAANAVVGKGKRKGKATNVTDAAKSLGNHILKKNRLVKTQARLATHEASSKIIEHVSNMIKDAITGAEGRMSERVSAEIQLMESRLGKDMQGMVKRMVEEYLSEKAVIESIDKIVCDINGQGKPHNGTPDVGTEAEHRGIMLEKFKIMSMEKVDTRELVFGPGLTIKDADLLDIPNCITPTRHEIMDSCVMVFRENLLSSLDPASEPRADFMPCRFAGSLGSQYSRFKKSKKKENFQFDDAFVLSIQERFGVTKKEWIKDTDFIYFPFNIDANRWLAVAVDMLSSTLTVFDSTLSACRGSRLRSEFEFLTEMIPYLVRKAAVNDQMKDFKTRPLSFHRDTDVAQASDWRSSGILALLFIEAHAKGGLAEVYAVNEGMLRLRAEQLAVEMYEHCCGDIE